MVRSKIYKKNRRKLKYGIPVNLINMVGKLEKVHGDPTSCSIEYRLEKDFERCGIGPRECSEASETILRARIDIAGRDLWVSKNEPHELKYEGS